MGWVELGWVQLGWDGIGCGIWDVGCGVWGGMLTPSTHEASFLLGRHPPSSTQLVAHPLPLRTNV